MLILDRSAILEAADVKKETVEVPEWGGSVYVRVMTGTDRDLFESSMYLKGDDRLINLRAHLCALTICNEDGTRLFSDADIEALGKKSGEALDRVFKTAQRINGLSGEEVAEIEKN